jgi:AraC-like DNA-binding protein
MSVHSHSGGNMRETMRPVVGTGIPVSAIMTSTQAPPMMLQQHADPNHRGHNYRQLAHQAGYHAGRLAQLCGVSLRQLERYFQSCYQCPPARWLCRERIRLARRLLDRSQPINQVANALGFKANSHFSTAFKRELGISPSQYLKRRRQLGTSQDSTPGE